MTEKKILPDLETNDLKSRDSLILQLMWPALLENVLSTLVSIADTIMVAGLGTNAVNAVGLVTQPRFIVLSCFIALGTGTTALVARFKGADDPDSANHATWQSLILTAVVIMIASVAMLIWQEPLIRFIAGDNIAEEAVVMATDYFRIQIVGFPALGLSFIMTAALRGVGNTKAAFYANAASNVVNIIFNWLLIGGNWGFPALGVAGASIATILGQGVAMLFALFLLLKGDQYINLRRVKSFRPDLHMIMRITRIGLPAALEQLIMRIGMMVFTLIVTSLGDIPYATHIIGMNLQSMSFCTGMSFGTAATTLTGQALGRKRPDLARWYVARSIRFGYWASFAVAIVLFFFGGSLASLYSSVPEILALAAVVLKIIAVANPLSNTRFVYNSALRGAGDARFTAVSTFLGIVLIRPLVAGILVYVFNMGLVGIWIALISDALLCYALGRTRWFRGKWETIAV